MTLQTGSTDPVRTRDIPPARAGRGRTGGRWLAWGGTIDTDMGDQVLVTRARNIGTNDIEAARRQVIERLPIGRMGTPSDIAKGIVFLASDDADFMTGAGLIIDGGITGHRSLM